MDTQNDGLEKVHYISPFENGNFCVFMLDFWGVNTPAPLSVWVMDLHGNLPWNPACGMVGMDFYSSNILNTCLGCGFKYVLFFTPNPGEIDSQFDLRTHMF